ncbi:MAG: GTP pyrophosphokinase [Parcubacteria group bacterium Gr01-1014_20]|nr:MAG: GTP pyrophosphokinase [Parcubacteria group bacterium Gr01-1014_20]
MPVLELALRNPESLIGRAYRFAENAHQGQRRETGEPYLSHLLETAEVLEHWHLDEETVAAGLLHDVLKLTKVRLAEIKTQFGDEVAFLVDGVNKLGLIKYRGTEAKIENLRKMILAMSQDLRIVFVKLANRLHNVKTLSVLPAEKRKIIAQETDEIYAPLASLLGMQNLSGELKDLSFPHLYPEKYAWLSKTVQDRYEDREKYLKQVEPILTEALIKNGIKSSSIDYRAKRYSSLYFKLLNHEMDLDKIYDLVAMRVVVPEIEDCYEVLGVVHSLWSPLPGRIKDYIANPKSNSYRSLHTTVLGPENKYLEIQIRTKKIHDENENGIASHWLYEKTRSGKEDGEKKSLKKILKDVLLVKQLRRWQEFRGNPISSRDDFIKTMKFDFFNDRIFVITPKGDVIDLPKGSTPVDFAYKIHTEVGNSCTKAKINGQAKALNVELASGDVVKIATQKGRKPEAEWLAFVKTPNAKENIRNTLKSKDKNLISRFF